MGDFGHLLMSHDVWEGVWYRIDNKFEYDSVLNKTAMYLILWDSYKRVSVVKIIKNI